MRKSGKRAGGEREESSADPSGPGLLAGEDDDTLADQGIDEDVIAEDVVDEDVLAEADADDAAPDDAGDAEKDAGTDDTTETKVPEALEAFFDAHLDEEGALPPGIDQAFANVTSTYDDDAREASYAAVPRERVPDYIPRIRNLAPKEPQEGEELSVGEALENGVKMIANKGIAAINDLAGSDLEKFPIPHSAQEDFLTALVNVEGLPLAAGAAAGGLALTGFALPALAVTSFGVGVRGVNAFLHAYDEPGRMEHYDAWLFDIMGTEGFIGEDFASKSQAERFIRVLLAEGVDFATFGSAFKLTGAAIKRLRPKLLRMNEAMGQEGAMTLKAWSKEGRIDPSDLHALTADELTEKAVRDDAAMREYLARNLSMESTQESITKLRTYHETTDYNPEMMRRLTEKIEKLERSTRSMIGAKKGWDKGGDLMEGEFDSFWATYNKTESDQALANVVMAAHKEFTPMAKLQREVVNEGTDAAITPVMLERLKRRKKLADRLMKNADSTENTAYADDLLLQAKKYMDIHALAELHRTGIRTAAHQALERNLDILWKYEDTIETLLERKRKGYFPQADADMLKMTRAKWDESYTALLKGDIGESWGDKTVNMALGAAYDNMLGNAALATATASGVGGLVSRGIFKKGFTPLKAAVQGHAAYVTRYPNVLTRMWHSVAANQKRRWGTKEGRQEVIDILRGKKLPRRMDKYGHTYHYMGTNPLRQLFNIWTGVSRTSLQLMDDIMESAHNSLSEVAAMEKIMQGFLHQPKQLKEFMTDLNTLSPKKFMDKHPDFNLRFTTEYRHQTDAMLFRANPHNFEDLGAMGRLGRWAFHGATKYGHYSANPGMRLVAHMAAPFPRVWANTLAHADRLTPVGLIGNKKGFKEAAQSDERQFGTVAFPLLALSSWFFHANDLPGVKIIDAGSKEGELRRLGGEGGVEIGGVFLKWDAMGYQGTAYKYMYRAMEIMRLLPPSDATNMYTDEMPGTEHGVGNRLAMAAARMGTYMIDDSFFQRGLSVLQFGMMTEDGEFVKKFFQQWAGGATSPGRSTLTRLTGGEATTTDNPVFYGLVEELREATDAATPEDVRRDALGVPWTRGEADMEETEYMTQGLGRLMFVFNPKKKGRTPKSNDIRRFLMENAALGGSKTVVANGKVISKKAFELAFGMAPPVFNEASRWFSANSIRYDLGPKAYNEKVTMMSLDWGAMERILDRYEVFWDTKAPATGMEGMDDRWRDRIQEMRGRLTYEWQEDNLRDYYPDATEKTRMVDVLHHIATAPLDRLGHKGEGRVRTLRDAWSVTAAENRRTRPYLQGTERLTDADILAAAESIARLTLMNEFYDYYEYYAEYIMEASPVGDAIRMVNYEGG